MDEALRVTFMSPEPGRCCRSPTRSSRPQVPCAGGCRPPCWSSPRIPDGPRWRLSKQRNASPTLALTDDPETARAMALYWGVTSLHVPELFETGQVLAFADEWCRSHDLIDSGDRVVIVRGVIPNNPNHNALLVHEVE